MADRVGQQLGNYRLTRLLGQGGFAEVYLGEHMHLGTFAAVKVLSTQLVGEDITAFRNEARTVARLEHPHIVRVLDFGIEGTVPFLVMGYAPNGSLRQRHPRGTPLPLPTILSYVKQVTDALQYAHDEKLMHRDIKPENMLLGRRNEVLLSDFGIALVAQSTRMQSVQEVIGTVAYMAPEMLQGKPRLASDQYALGIVVYEWLCGERPFHGSFAELASQHMFVPPPSLREKMPTITAEIEQVVMTALAKDPHQRFSDVQTFATALAQAIQAIQAEASQTITANNILPPVDVKSQLRSAQTPAEAASLSSESLIPTVLVTPPSQITTPGEPSTPLSQTEVPAATVTPSGQATIPPTGLTAPSSQATTSPPVPIRSSSVSDTLLPPKPPQPKPGISRGRLMLLIGLVLLIVAGSAGVFFTAMSNQQTNAIDATSTSSTLNSTATASAVYTGIAATETAIPNETATSLAFGNATATAGIIAARAMYNPATSGTPALDDPLIDNSKGYNWCVGICDDKYNFGGSCSFTGTGYESIITYCPALNTDFSNFAYQIQVTLPSGNYPTYQWKDICGGIFFRANTTSFNNGDSFWVCLDGTCELDTYYGGPRINAACAYKPHQANLLTVIAQHNVIYAYINQQYFAQVTDNTVTHGQIGVHASSDGALYNNAEVWRL